VPVKSFWYMPIRERITYLLRSDMKNLVYYMYNRRHNSVSFIFVAIGCIMLHYATLLMLQNYCILLHF
jgi:hypothetical protein